MWMNYILVVFVFILSIAINHAQPAGSTPLMVSYFLFLCEYVHQNLISSIDLSFNIRLPTMLK